MPESKQAQSGRNSKVIRTLGNLEAYHIARHLLDQYRGTMVTCQYAVPQDLVGPEQNQKLCDAVDLAVSRTILQHPVLQVGLIEQDSKRPSYVELETVDLRHHVQWQIVEPSADYEAMRRNATVRQLDERFFDQETQPGWRLVILQSQGDNIIEIMFTWNHHVTDGMGAKLFHESLLHFFNTPPDGEAKINLQDRVLDIAGHAKHFPPGQENMCKYEVSTMFAAKEIWKTYKLPFHGHAPGEDATWSPKRLDPYTTGVRSIRLDNTALKKVLSACREHKTTLTGLFHGIMVLSMASHLGEHEATAFRSQTAVNMRPFTPSPPREYPWLKPKTTMCNIVSGISHDFNATTIRHIRQKAKIAGAEPDNRAHLTESLWSASVSARGDIQKFSQLGTKNNIVGLLKYIRDMRHLSREILKAPRQYSWLVTNLGVFDGGDRNGDKWAMNRAAFLLCADVPGPAIQLGIVAVKGGDLCVDFTWQEGVVDVKLVERVVEDVGGWLKYLGCPFE